MAAGVSRYVAHLPAVFQDDDFVGAFLLAFERILTGLPGRDPPNLPRVPLGLEQILDTIETYFDPSSAPAEFLPWLAGWVATSLREDWDTATRRGFIEQGLQGLAWRQNECRAAGVEGSASRDTDNCGWRDASAIIADRAARACSSVG